MPGHPDLDCSIFLTDKYCPHRRDGCIWNGEECKRYFPPVVMVKARRMTPYCWPEEVPEVLELTGWTTQNFLTNDCTMYEVGAVIRTAYEACPGLQVNEVCIWTEGEDRKEDYCAWCYRCSWILSCITDYPTHAPTIAPSYTHPTVSPSCPTGSPSKIPSFGPSRFPSTSYPTGLPTRQPSASNPTLHPTSPTAIPSQVPSVIPSDFPSQFPSRNPSTTVPSFSPQSNPSTIPSRLPIVQPSRQPSLNPVYNPSSAPLSLFTSQPSQTPSFEPSKSPYSSVPTLSPQKAITFLPSAQPSQFEPSTTPSIKPTSSPFSNFAQAAKIVLPTSPPEPLCHWSGASHAPLSGLCHIEEAHYYCTQGNDTELRTLCIPSYLCLNSTILYDDHQYICSYLNMSEQSQQETTRSFFAIPIQSSKNISTSDIYESRQNISTTGMYEARQNISTSEIYEPRQNTSTSNMYESRQNNGLAFAYFITGVSISICSVMICAYFFFFRWTTESSNASHKSEKNESTNSIKIPGFTIKHIWANNNALYANDMKSNKGSYYRNSIRSHSKSSTRYNRSSSSRRTTSKTISLQSQASLSLSQRKSTRKSQVGASIPHWLNKMTDDSEYLVE